MAFAGALKSETLVNSFSGVNLYLRQDNLVDNFKKHESLAYQRNNQSNHSLSVNKFYFTLLLVCFFSVFHFLNCFSQKTGCSQINPEFAFKLDDRSLFPEGISYDAKTRQFFISSLSKFKVVSVDRKGKQNDFITSGQDSILRCVCVKVDEKLRRLWILSVSGWSENIISAIHVYNIDTRQLITKKFTSLGPKPVFNDMVIGYQGEAMIIDYEGACIYSFRPETNRLEILAESDMLEGANGISISPDQNTLFVNTRYYGILLVDVITKKIRPVSNPLSIDLSGLDGITFYKNSLLAVMCKEDDSGNPLIIRYFMDKLGSGILGASIVDYKNPLFSIPTNGVMVGDDYYCLAATNLHLFSLNENTDDEKLVHPLVLKYTFKGK
jgi:hypothetical protein